MLTWTGSLNPGDTATITYTVTVDSPDTGGKVLANAAASADPGSTCPAGSTGPPCGLTIPVIAGALTITAPGTSNLGTASVASNLSGDLGTVQVTDNRGFGAGWTATVSSTSFATGTGTPADTIPVSDASYNITALSQATGPATFTPVPVTQLSTAPPARRQRHQRHRQHHRQLEPHHHGDHPPHRHRRPLHRHHHPLRVLTGRLPDRAPGRCNHLSLRVVFWIR